MGWMKWIAIGINAWWLYDVVLRRVEKIDDQPAKWKGFEEQERLALRRKNIEKQIEKIQEEKRIAQPIDWMKVQQEAKEREAKWQEAQKGTQKKG